MSIYIHINRTKNSYLCFVSKYNSGACISNSGDHELAESLDEVFDDADESSYHHPDEIEIQQIVMQAIENDDEEVVDLAINQQPVSNPGTIQNDHPSE